MVSQVGDTLVKVMTEADVPIVLDEPVKVVVPLHILGR
jgi:hypothetical protein